MGPGQSQRRLRWPRSAVCHCVKPPAAFTALPGPLSSPAGSEPRVWGCVWVHTRPRASCPDGLALPGPGPGSPRKVRRVWRWHGDSHSPSICSRDAPCPPSDRRPCESLAPGGAPCRRLRAPAPLRLLTAREVSAGPGSLPPSRCRPPARLALYAFIFPLPLSSRGVF